MLGKETSVEEGQQVRQRTRTGYKDDQQEDKKNVQKGRLTRTDNKDEKQRRTKRTNNKNEQQERTTITNNKNEQQEWTTRTNNKDKQQGPNNKDRTTRTNNQDKIVHQQLIIQRLLLKTCTSNLQQKKQETNSFYNQLFTRMILLLFWHCDSIILVKQKI